MRIIRRIIAIIIAIILISRISGESNDRLAAPEQAIFGSDHSECAAVIAACEEENQILRRRLEEACRSAELILNIEFAFIPDLLDDVVLLRFQSAPIRINAAAAEGLSAGDDLSADSGGSRSILEQIIDCRIVIADISIDA